MASTSSSSTEDILPQLLPPSASSSMVYDVFLNYSGCDVKEGLATDIYHTLNRMRRRVFLDQQVLEYGDSIPKETEDAISNASVCIAIFSANYAESSWCLEELSFMIKNKKKIIPIFYDVEPSDLRWVAQGKGVYVKAFSQLENKPGYTPQKLEEWQRALYNVSFFFGHEVKNKEYKGKLLKSIVESVLTHIPLPLEVAQHPVGLDEIVEDFENTFKSSDRKQHVDIVGIVGMGGSGKTTLSIELYNRKCLKIGRHSFISEVRDAAAKNTLHNKQEKLLCDLLPKKQVKKSIDNTTEGKGILRARLSSLRVLIVLDDVDHVDQIDALLPEKGCIFAARSLIIVTTRELDVLRSLNISCIYKMKPLNPIHAKQLFCWHAFMRSDPLQEFEDLVKEVMNTCKGLPLSLKVLGAHFYGSPQDYWVSQLDKISRILLEDITKILKISFDALDAEQKEMFLDTACFFLGEGKSLAIEVWDGLGLFGLCDWETLLSKCLVELDRENRICMHDHLRDMGRELAKERPPNRLLPSSNLDISRLVQERIPIRGIMEASTDHSGSWSVIAKPSSDYRPFSKEYIKLKPSSCRVQLLVAANEFSEECAMLSKELRWLRLFKFQHSCLPSWLSLENLRVLELYDAPDLEELWQGNMQPPLQLRELIIHLGDNNRFRRFPRSIKCVRHLKKLSCIRGRYLQNLPKGFCKLQSLEYLELKYLEDLSSLPSRFGNLTNLRHLDLFLCSKLKTLPDSFKQLKHLQYLNFALCSNLTFTEHNADILENITKLEYLNFVGCEGLQVLPHHITKQAFLRELNLAETSLTELPSSIGQLQRLEVLTIGSAELESLPDSVGNLSSLTRLQIDGCKKVRSLPESVGRLALLESLYIESSGMESLPKAFGQLNSLKSLYIDDLPIRELFFEFEESPSLPRLKSITLRRTRMSTMSIPEDSCPSLESLEVSDNDFLVEIRTLPRKVKTIELFRCKMLKDIAGIRSIPNLQDLTIWTCPELAELPTFAESASIKRINIGECQTSGKMEGLEQLTSLETLEVQTRWEVPGITSLEHAQGLERLRLSAEKIGAVEPCIKTLQKWPADVIICARALSGVDTVESVVKAFTSSNLMVVEACADDADDEDDEDDGDEEADEDGCTLNYRKTYWSALSYMWGERRVRYPKASLSHEASIECFVINCLCQDKSRDVVFVDTGAGPGHSFNIKLPGGKWVWIGVFTQGLSHVDGYFEASFLGKCSLTGNRVEKGLLATGQEREVIDLFYRVLDALKM